MTRAGWFVLTGVVLGVAGVGLGDSLVAWVAGAFFASGLVGLTVEDSVRRHADRVMTYMRQLRGGER